MVTALESISLLFLATVLQALPFLLLGALVSAIVGSGTNPPKFLQYLPESNFGQIILGALSGLWLPVGESGTIPVARQLQQMEVPKRFTAAFLAAAPIVNPITIASLWVVFGFGDVLIGSIVMALAAALVTGAVVDLQITPNTPQMRGQPEVKGKEEGQATRLQRTAVVAADLLFETGRWLTLGALTSAIILVVFTPGRLLGGKYGGIAWVMVSGVLEILHSTEASSAPFALIPLLNLIPKSAMISTIVVGSLASIKRVVMLRSVFEGFDWLEIVLVPAATCIVLAVGLVTFWQW